MVFSIYRHRRRVHILGAERLAPHEMGLLCEERSSAARESECGSDGPAVDRLDE